MDSNIARTRAISIVSPAHALFAATMVALGILGLLGNPPPTWTGVPRSNPAHDVVLYLCALVSLACGLGLLWRRTAAVASRVLLIYFLAWLVLIRVPTYLRAPTALNAWWSCGDTLVMTGAAWVLYAWFAGDRDRQRVGFATGDNGLRIARALFGLGLIPFGVAHFVNLPGTESLVPGWLPWHVAWAYFTGGAFVVAGLAMIIGMYARLAAVLAALQMGLFTLLIWVPLVVAGPNPGQWAEFVSSWTLTAAGWMVADSYRGMPWLGVGKR